MTPETKARKGFLILSSVLAAGLIVPTAPRGACIDYAGYLRWEGGISIDGGASASSIAVLGSLACVIDGDRLVLVDVIDPAYPIEDSRLALPAVSSGVAIYGETVFVAAGGAGLVVVDAHDRSLPTIVRVVPLPKPAASVTVSGVNAFVAADGNPSGLYVFDVSAPANPGLIGSLDLPGQGTFVAATSGRAYVAAGTSGLHVIDVTRPGAPALLGTVDTPGRAVGVALSGTIAYVADLDGGLHIVDASNPASPRITSTVLLPGSANAVAFSGSDAYLACGTPGLVVVDLSEPTFPRVGGTADMVGYSWGIAVSGQHVYLAAGTRLLQIANVANPRTPAPIATATLAGPVRDLAVAGAYVYVAEGSSGVEIMQTPQSGSPVHAGTLATPGDAAAIASTGEDRLIIGVEGAGILIADVNLPTAPQILGQTSAPLHPLSIAINGNTILVAAGGEGLYVIDISNATAPNVMSIVPTPFQAVGVAVAADRYACVSDPSVGLLIIDLLDPTTPTTIGQLPFGASSDVAFSRPFVYVSDGTGVRVVDIVDPTAPAQVGRVDLSGQPGRIFAVGTTLYAVSEDQGLQIVDAQDPGRPTLHGGVVLPRAHALRPVDTGVFVGSSDSTLWIMPTQCAILPVYFPQLGAEVEEDGVRIRWDVAADILFDGFIVERADADAGDGDLPFVPLNGGGPVSGRGPFEYLDRTAVPGATYLYRVTGLVPGGERIVSGPIRVAFEPGRSLSMLPPAPNPMRNGAAFSFLMDHAGIARLSLCDAAGRRIRMLIDGPVAGGAHRLEWDGLDDAGRRVAAGTYWIRLESEGRSLAGRLVVLR